MSDYSSERTVSNERGSSRWDFLSDLREQERLPLPEFCRELAQRFVASGEVAACGLWHIDPTQGSVSLIVNAGLLVSPLTTHPMVSPEHQKWLRSVISTGSPRQRTWHREYDISPDSLRADAARICIENQCRLVLETVRSFSQELGEDEGFQDLLEELARLVERRWQATPPRLVSVTAYPPQISLVETAPPAETDGLRTSPAIQEEQTSEKFSWQTINGTGGQQKPENLSSHVDENFHSTVRSVPPCPVPIPSDSPKASSLESITDWQALWKLSLGLQHSLATRDVAEVAANDGRLWLNCDRVTVLAGTRPRIVAVSGLAQWSRRSPWVSLLEQLAQRVMAGREPLTFPLDSNRLAEEIERPLAAYVAESQPRALFVVPLKISAAVDDEYDQQTSRANPRWIGCVVAEQFLTGDVSPELPLRVRRFAECLARPLENAERYESIFLLPAWRAIGKGIRWLRGRRLAWTALLLVILASSIAGFILIPWEYRVEAPGQFLPGDRRDVFVPSDSEVQEILVKSGDQVVTGQLLMRLKDRELETELVTTRTEWEEKRKLFRALQFQIDQARKTGLRDGEHHLFGQLEETRALIAGLTKRLEILNRRSSDLEVRAPLAGTIATFQVEQVLRHRPVQRGDVLMTIMQEDGPWQLELRLDESRWGHLIHAQSLSTNALAIEYVLVTAPEVHYTARLREIATRTTLAEDDRLIVRLIADPSPGAVPILRIGTEVRARIACGPKPLGYVMFGDVVEFLQRYVWW